MIVSGDELRRFEPKKIVEIGPIILKIMISSQSGFENRRCSEKGSNRHISDVSVCIEKTKPFDILAKRLF